MTCQSIRDKSKVAGAVLLAQLLLLALSALPELAALLAPACKASAQETVFCAVSCHGGQPGRGTTKQSLLVRCCSPSCCCSLSVYGASACSSPIDCKQHTLRLRSRKSGLQLSACCLLVYDRPGQAGWCGAARPAAAACSPSALPGLAGLLASATSTQAEQTVARRSHACQSIQGKSKLASAVLFDQLLLLAPPLRCLGLQIAQGLRQNTSSAVACSGRVHLQIPVCELKCNPACFTGSLPVGLAIPASSRWLVCVSHLLQLRSMRVTLSQLGPDAGRVLLLRCKARLQLTAGLLRLCQLLCDLQWRW